MNKKTEIIKDGVLVTMGSFLILVVAFMLYYVLFMIFSTMTNKDTTYSFVASLRIGYGIIWMIFCFIIYKTSLPEWFKASILVGSLTTFMAGIGVQSYRTPIVINLVLLIISAAGMVLLIKTKMKWHHYYALVLSVMATIFYMW
ncbi:hypothetical protein [Petrocella atlantisensis]|uniref:hypothetical protein n=1 Tax=Petrocella atlantisensis TaxID=2173034 RepID=UPI000F63E135|nr:hypothetical protein [Petrocella atlantisensis]